MIRFMMPFSSINRNGLGSALAQRGLQDSRTDWQYTKPDR